MIYYYLHFEPKSTWKKEAKDERQPECVKVQGVKSLDLCKVYDKFGYIVIYDDD